MQDLNIGRRGLLLGVTSLVAVAITLLIGQPARAERDIGRLCPARFASETTFVDLAPGSTHARAVYCIADAGITRGTTASTYGPDQPVSRGQMATFLFRMLNGTIDPVPDALEEGPWDTVGHTHEGAIAALLEAGVIEDDFGAFRPDDPIRRDEMAGWMQGTWWWITGDYLWIDDQPFHDMVGNYYEPDVAGLYVHGVINGKAHGYDPAGPVTRAQMGSFLARLMTMHADAGHVPGWDEVSTTTIVPTTAPNNGGSTSTTSDPDPDPPTEPGLGGYDVGEQQLFEMFNSERARFGAEPLIRNACLDVVAQEWAQNLANGAPFEHRSNADLTNRTEACLPGFLTWGEIIAMNPEIGGVMHGWMTSPPHRDEILDEFYLYVGIGVWQDADGVLWAVANFAVPG